MNGNRESSKKITWGSPFCETNVRVNNHSDIPKTVSIFKFDRASRLDAIIKSIKSKPTPEQIRSAQFEAEWLIVQQPIVSSSRYPRRTN